MVIVEEQFGNPTCYTTGNDTRTYLLFGRMKTYIDPSLLYFSANLNFLGKKIKIKSHAECDLDIHECDFDMHECDNDTHECDKDTYELDFYTQSVMSTRRKRFLQLRVRFRHARV
jgi:hypothetical protein